MRELTQDEKRLKNKTKKEGKGRVGVCPATSPIPSPLHHTSPFTLLFCCLHSNFIHVKE